MQYLLAPRKTRGEMVVARDIDSLVLKLPSVIQQGRV
jgi:hypothetical protein